MKTTQDKLSPSQEEGVVDGVDGVVGRLPGQPPPLLLPRRRVERAAARRRRGRSSVVVQLVRGHPASSKESAIY